MPRQYQIAEALRQQIVSGALQPGDPLPTIAAVARRWNTTPATAQKALQLLKDEGLTTGGRGKPATVRVPPRRVRVDDHLRQALKDAVHKSAEERAAIRASELAAGIPIDQTDFKLRYEVVPAPEDLASEFGIKPGAELLRRTYETVDRATGYLILWSVSYIPKALIEGNPELLDESKEPWPGGHQHQLSTVGIEVDRFDNTVFAVAASVADRDRWGMDLGVPLLRMHSKSIDTNGRVVEISESEYPADRAEIAWTQQLERWS